LYDVVVIKVGKEFSFLSRGISKKDADAELADWLLVFNEENFYTPVPTVKVVPHKSYE
jgi:hypothetical protein